MKKFTKRLTALLCAMLMSLTLLPVETFARETATPYAVPTDELVQRAYGDTVFLEEDDAAQTEQGALLYDDGTDETGADSRRDPYFDQITVERYGRTTLEEETNSEQLLNVYDTLVECAATLPMPEYIMLKEAVSKETFALAATAFRGDYPELFWAIAAPFSFKGEDVVRAVGLTKFVDRDTGREYFPDLDSAKTKFLAAAEELLEGLPVNGSDYEKELYLHDKLIRHVVYTYDYAKYQSAYSAMVDGKAVCAGYAFAFQYLLMRAGIQCAYVTGYSGESHAWNLVKIDGAWYYTDPTWDDPLTQDPETEVISESPYSPYYAFFNLTAERMGEDHELDPYPENVRQPVCNSTAAFYHRLKNTVVSVKDEGLVEKVATLLRRGNGQTRLFVTDDDPMATAWEWYRANLGKLRDLMKATGRIDVGIAGAGREVVLTFKGEYEPLPSGNLNGKGEVDSTDMQLLYTYLLTKTVPQDQTTLSEADFLFAADLNDDDVVDVYDLQALYEMITGIR